MPLAKESRSRTRISRRKSPPPEATSERLNPVARSRPLGNGAAVARARSAAGRCKAGHFRRRACLLFIFDLQRISREARKATWPQRLRAPRDEDFQGEYQCWFAVPFCSGSPWLRPCSVWCCQGTVGPKTYATFAAKNTRPQRRRAR